MSRSAREIDEQTPWQDLTLGGEIFEAATAAYVRTGEWRSDVPAWHREKCKQCMICVPYCPDSSIPVVGGKRIDFDFDHCKGCGICYKVCPFQAITFGKEERA